MKQNQTITGFLFLDVDGNGLYDPKFDLLPAGINVSVVRPTSFQRAGAVVLATTVSNSSGYFVFTTTKIKPNDTLQIVDEAGKVLLPIEIGPDGTVSKDLYQVAVTPPPATSASATLSITLSEVGSLMEIKGKPASLS